MQRAKIYALSQKTLKEKRASGGYEEEGRRSDMGEGRFDELLEAN